MCSIVIYIQIHAEMKTTKKSRLDSRLGLVLKQAVFVGSSLMHYWRRSVAWQQKQWEIFDWEYVSICNIPSSDKNTDSTMSSVHPLPWILQGLQGGQEGYGKTSLNLWLCRSLRTPKTSLTQTGPSVEVKIVCIQNRRTRRTWVAM